jgi:hypothetical protein
MIGLPPTMSGQLTMVRMVNAKPATIPVVAPNREKNRTVERFSRRSRCASGTGNGVIRPIRSGATPSRSRRRRPSRNSPSSEKIRGSAVTGAP